MAREGLYFSLPLIILSFGALYIMQSHPNIIWGFIAAGLFSLGCVLSLFFRDPDRRIPGGEAYILSPADGKVIAIDDSNDQIAISIFLSVFNVHINRLPVTGVVKRVVYKPGRFFAAFKKEASQFNRRYEIEIETDKGNVTVHQIAGVIARKVVCRLQPGQKVKAGDRFGLIYFGSRVDLLLPKNIELDIKSGQKIKGGATIIGSWR